MKSSHHRMAIRRDAPFAGTGLERSPVSGNTNNAWNVNNDGNLNNNDVNNTGAAVRPDSPPEPETRLHAEAVRAVR